MKRNYFGRSSYDAGYTVCRYAYVTYRGSWVSKKIGYEKFAVLGEMNLLKWTYYIVAAACLAAAAAGLSGCASDTDSGQGDVKEVHIGVGYQTVTAQTWGPLIMKNKGFLEDELKKVAPDKAFVIDWQNAQSGPPLTNNMIAGKLQFSVMGDMPLLINGEKGETMGNYDSVFLAFDGKGKEGKNQAILVPKDSSVQSVQDLAGKTVGVPIGSSAHRMLLDELNKNGIADQVQIVGQDATVGMSNIEQNKVDAYAIWEPFPSIAVNKQAGRVLISGDDTKVDYLDGVVADKKWVTQHPEYTVAFLTALVRAHQFIQEHPDEAAAIFAKETGYSQDIAAQMVRNIRFDAVIYQKDIATLESSKEFLQRAHTLKQLDLSSFIDDSYLRKAVVQAGKSYPDDTALQGDWIS